MVRAVSKENIGEYFNLNVKFHNLIGKVAGSRTLEQMLEMLDGLTLRYRFLALSMPGRLAESLREHERIIEALRQANPQEAAKAAKDSALQSANTLVRYLFDHQGAVSV
jgi:DNA-binding GntR family transcriptional regulator